MPLLSRSGRDPAVRREGGVRFDLFVVVCFCVNVVVTSVCTFLGIEGPKGPGDADFSESDRLSFAVSPALVNSNR
jgi:hypothetical protein